MDPSSSESTELAAHSVEWEFATPDIGFGSVNMTTKIYVKLKVEANVKTVHPLLIHFLEICGEDPRLEVGRASSEQDTIRMPVERQDSGPYRFLDVLGSPPVLLLIELTDCNGSRSRSYSELGLVGRPSDKGGRAVDTQEYQGGSPCVGGCVEGPHVGVPVLRARHDAGYFIISISIHSP